MLIFLLSLPVQLTKIGRKTTGSETPCALKFRSFKTDDRKVGKGKDSLEEREGSVRHLSYVFGIKSKLYILGFTVSM